MIHFEHHIQKRYMLQSFSQPVSRLSEDHISKWRELWMDELMQWHSPYKVLIDATQVQDIDPSVAIVLKDLFAFFEGFFMRQAVVVSASHLVDRWPIVACLDLESAQKELGLRLQKQTKEAVDFRDLVQIQNFFEQHTMEIGFSSPVMIDNNAQIEVIKSKIVNQLAQWHSKWNLMMDCQNITRCDPSLEEDWQKAFRYLKGLFMKQVVGYQGDSKLEWPFPMYRSRHKAAAQLQGEGDLVADKADCQSRKT